MRIAIVGPGAIGSTFAFQLVRAGHEVTVVARGARLAALERDGAVVRADGARAAVTVTGALDETAPYDLVLVTVLATQVGAVLPSLRASAARRVMFMFNTFESIAPLRDAVGAERFSFGFPGGVFCRLVDGKIHPQIRPGTTVGDAALAKVFAAAGLPTVVDDDMQSWLRTHAAMVTPLMAAGVVAFTQRRGVTWREARSHADAFVAGFAIVRAGGNSVRPAALGAVSRLPRLVIAALLWAMSRTKTLRDLGALGATEPRMLVDMMNAASPTLAGPLVAIRP